MSRREARLNPEGQRNVNHLQENVKLLAAAAQQMSPSRMVSHYKCQTRCMFYKLEKRVVKSSNGSKYRKIGKKQENVGE